MEPYVAKKLPIEYNLDKELLQLLGEANEKYGEYKSLLKTANFDFSFFLDSILLGESLKSTQIEGSQISQDDMYYLKYMKKTDDSLEIQNLKEVVNYAEKELKNNRKIDLELVNNMNKILLNSVRGNNKNPGKVRDSQNWIGPLGVGIDGASFIPPKPEDVPLLLNNLFEYMNDGFVDPVFVNLAISHAQFETIHAYKDGNGRLGRALIPIQLARLTDEKPILFLSEVIEIYKPSYQMRLNETRKGNVTGFIKFFLQCVIEQCNVYISKINKIKSIYKDDMQTIELVNGAGKYKVMPSILKHVVFTKKEIELDTGLSESTVSRIVDKLTEFDILVKDDSKIKKGYKYKRIYDVFVGKDN